MFMFGTAAQVGWMVHTLPESEQGFVFEAMKRLLPVRNLCIDSAQNREEQIPWSEMAERVARMVDVLPKNEQLFAFELAKRSLSACGLAVSPAEALGITL